jgi:hypothetical protein
MKIVGANIRGYFSERSTSRQYEVAGKQKSYLTKFYCINTRKRIMMMIVAMIMMKFVAD